MWVFRIILWLILSFNHIRKFHCTDKFLGRCGMYSINNEILLDYNIVAGMFNIFLKLYTTTFNMNVLCRIVGMACRFS